MTEEMSVEDLQRRKKSRFVLLAMLVLFSAPYVASFVLYNFGDKFNIGTTNYGELLNPRVSFESINFKTTENKSVDVKAYKGKWLLLATGTAECGEPCKASLYKMRQVRKLMAVDRAWIRRAYAITNKGDLSGLQDFMQDYEGTDLFTISEVTLGNIEQKLNIEKGTVENRMILIDPAGDIILTYPQDPDPKGVHGDIEKLFKVTKRE